MRFGSGAEDVSCGRSADEVEEKRFGSVAVAWLEVWDAVLAISEGVS